MKKIIKVFVIGLIVCSCEREPNTFSCSDVRFGVTECYSSIDTTFKMYFENGKLGMCIQDIEGGFEDYRVNNRLNLYKYSFVVTKKPFQSLVYKYDLKGRLSNEVYINKEIGESIDCFHGENFKEYTIFYKLPNLNETVPIYQLRFDETGKILPGYTYYIKSTNKTYEIVTDAIEFSYKNTLRDSMYIEYAEIALDKVKFEHPDEQTYYPNFENVHVRKIYDSKTGISYKKDSVLVGVMWSFFGNKGTAPFAYQQLIFNGDLMSRLEKIKKEVAKSDKDNSKLSKSLKEKLLKSGFVEQNGKLQIGKTLSETLKEVR